MNFTLITIFNSKKNKPNFPRIFTVNISIAPIIVKINNIVTVL